MVTDSLLKLLKGKIIKRIADLDGKLKIYFDDNTILEIKAFNKDITYKKYEKKKSKYER